MEALKSKTHLRDWGSSKALRIPKPFLKELNIQGDDEVEITLVENSIVIKKVPKNKSLRERYEEFYGTDFEVAVKNNPYTEDEIPWSGAEGEEIW
ncbi:MAG: AbrB/MazE/SpoVT family DNA-binding domain-containing protein [Defluviitaleaceae bacterium]|nr:AbrB/MazE/SpoVT family DNA-binding domain-containing protein [Defluviitaleaceae bacterium]